MATLKDVAKAAGLSVGTVSRVLNNRGYISEETRQSVYAAMEQLNYQPNEVARSLSKQKTSTIGLIMPSIEHPYFAKLISCLERAAYERNTRFCCSVLTASMTRRRSLLKPAGVTGLRD